MPGSPQFLPDVASPSGRRRRGLGGHPPIVAPPARQADHSGRTDRDGDTSHGDIRAGDIRAGAAGSAGNALWAALALALPAALLALLPEAAAGWLELDLARRATEPWRLITGHWLHWSASHLAWDLALFAALTWACWRDHPRSAVLALALAALGIGLGLPLLAPEIAVYRGLSGLATALFTLLAARRILPTPGTVGAGVAGRWLGLAALAGLAAKVGWETLSGIPVFLSASPNLTVVPAAHAMGAVAGLLAAGSFAASRR